MDINGPFSIAMLVITRGPEGILLLVESLSTSMGRRRFDAASSGKSKNNYYPEPQITYLSIYLSICLSIYLSIHPSIYLPTYPSYLYAIILSILCILSVPPILFICSTYPLYLSIYLSVYLSVYVPNPV